MNTCDNGACCEGLGFLRGADWRWQSARLGAAGQLPQQFLHGDAMIEQAADFLRLSAGGNEQSQRAARRYPRVHAAFELWSNPAMQRRLKTLAIGGCQPSEIATSFDCDEETIAVTLSLFFDIADKLGAPGWVAAHVIAPVRDGGDLDLAVAMKFAFFGGPAAARAVLDAGDRLPFDKAERLFDESLLLHLKAEAALELPLRDEANRTTFLVAYLHHLEKTAELSLECEKFRHRCELQARRPRPAKQPVPPDAEVSAPRIVIADLEAEAA